MNNNTLLKTFTHDLISGWKWYELLFLVSFTIAIIWSGIVNPYEKLNALGIVAGISGTICNVFVSKGKISNYFFGLIFAYSYFYVALGNNFLGEMNTTLYVYIPAQFIGYFLWKQNMHQQVESDAVITKALTLKGWVGLLSFMAIGTLLFVQTLNAFGGSSTGLDGLTTIIVVAAQTLMILRYREQWILWIALNILSIALWAENSAMYLMYIAYLLNSIYGYWNWSKLQKQAV
ncbi:nicotinamide riboside transporter pnuC [Pasteurellaceae bacterium Macca]|nr:nicotinamide riboside transporter pnuC [Pasteurellaceae bacterium Macca]